MIFIQKSLKPNKLINLLIDFGAHIGDFTNYKHFEQSIAYYIFCIRQNIFVIDISKTVSIFQRAIQFIYILSRNLGRLLFYHSSINSFFLKFTFFYLIKYKTNNSFINSKLQGGFLSNYRECFLRFIKTLSNIPMKIRSKRIFRIKLKLAELDSYARNGFYFRYLFLKLIYLTFEKSYLKRD
jgi:ribosomal protein S2